MTARQLPQTEYNSLKTAFRDLVKAVGTQQQCAERTRVDQTTISNYGSTDQRNAEVFAPIDVIADLEAEVGPIVTLKLARLCNHELVPLPAVVRTRNPLGKITGAAMKETAEVFAKLGAYLDDGRLDAAEAAKLDDEIDEAIRMLLALRARVDFEASGEPQ